MSANTPDTSVIPDPPDDNLRQAIDSVLQSLRGLRFGHVTITVQDGVVVQIERVERKRLNISRKNA